MALTLVLSVGFDPEIQGHRIHLLQSAGYTVVRAYSLKGAVECFLTLDFDLVLLCQSIPAKEKDRLICLIRASGSRIPVVSISGQLCQTNASTVETVGSDPEALLMGIREVLIKSAGPAARAATIRDKQEVADAPRKNPPRSSDGYKGRTKATEEHFASLALAG